MRMAGLLMVVAVIASAGCARRYGIEHGVRPADGGASATGARCRIIQDAGVELAVEYVDAVRWETLLSHRRFRKKRPRDSTSRMPRYHLFHVVIRNAGRAPLRVPDVTLVAGALRQAPIARDELKKRGKSKAFSAVQLARLVEPMRLEGGARCPAKIDYDRDAIGYGLPVIAPGETVARIVAFEWLPVEIRSCVLEVVLAPPGGVGSKKVIAFAYRRYEYRTHGTVFLDPERASKEKGDED
ncbi:MAG TPA: hypothetical protein PKM65_06630 [Spirochaetota bacterium]|nr:hypothetical protein [Spirochaetota bacterium]HNT09967.1 hypothetical protein [Spirochaetota bacterium]